MLRLILILLVGAVLGTLIGEGVSRLVPATAAVLGQGLHTGFAPVSVDLLVLQVTLGLGLRLTLAGLLGAVAAFWLAH